MLLAPTSPTSIHPLSSQTDYPAAIINEKIEPNTATEHDTQLDYAPQPNCYLEMQDGDGPSADASAFRTAIFSITKDDSWKGNVQQVDDGCNCKAQCLAYAEASAQCQPASNRLVRRWMGLSR